MADCWLGREQKCLSMRLFLMLYMTVNWHREFAVNFATFLKCMPWYFHFCTVIFVQPYTPVNALSLFSSPSCCLALSLFYSRKLSISSPSLTVYLLTALSFSPHPFSVFLYLVYLTYIVIGKSLFASDLHWTNRDEKFSKIFLLRFIMLSV